MRADPGAFAVHSAPPLTSLLAALVCALRLAGDGCGGSWRVRDFGTFLHRQARWQVANRRLQYNEIIVDGDRTRANAPQFVDAFFYTAGKGEAEATHQHAIFTGEFGAASAGLVRLDTGDWSTPFSVG